MNILGLFAQTDALGKLVFVLLLIMSTLSWALILFKVWVLWGAEKKVQKGIAAFWQAPDLASAALGMQQCDRTQWSLQLVQAVSAPATSGLAAQGDAAMQYTRALRAAVLKITQQLQFGQTMLATIGSTAPFIGLLGTVWGIYHALINIGGHGHIAIDKISAPVGEALIMTALGLAVAIPAVLAYNFSGRSSARVAAALEGFARDLRALFLQNTPQT